jgi:hypothetical protein
MYEIVDRHFDMQIQAFTYKCPRVNWSRLEIKNFTDIYAAVGKFFY